MKAHTTFVSLVSGLLFVSGAALAGDMEASFQKIDANNDGVVTQQEAAVDSELKNSFAQIDVNQDGYLTKSEYTANSSTEWEDDSEEAE